MTDEELKTLAEESLEYAFGRSHDLARGYLALLARFAEVEAERQQLLEWRANVTAALGKAGGCHFADVVSEIRTLKKHLVDAQAGQLTWECQDCDHECQQIIYVSGGEIVKACPRCRKGIELALSRGTMFHCPCGYSYAEPVYWQRAKGPTT